MADKGRGRTMCLSLDVYKAGVSNPDAIYEARNAAQKYFTLGGMPNHPNLYLTIVTDAKDAPSRIITAYPQKSITGVEGNPLYINSKGGGLRHGGGL